jgi:hypothetical protein
MISSSGKILLIKIIHTIIWVIMVAGIGYILYCGIYDKIDGSLYIALGLLGFEIITLLINRWTCPLTIVAKRINPRLQPGDDIFLPRWLAIQNKNIFGFILMVGLLLVLYRVLTR